jgi:hypothetical protein
MLRYHEELSRGPHASQLGNLARPPMREPRDWRAGISPRRKRLMEAACRPSLRKFGYPVGARSGWPLLEGLLTPLYLAYGSSRGLAVRLRLRRWR